MDLTKSDLIRLLYNESQIQETGQSQRPARKVGLFCSEFAQFRMDAILIFYPFLSHGGGGYLQI